MKVEKVTLEKCGKVAKVKKRAQMSDAWEEFCVGDLAADEEDIWHEIALHLLIPDNYTCLPPEHEIAHAMKTDKSSESPPARAKRRAAINHSLVPPRRRGITKNRTNCPIEATVAVLRIAPSDPQASGDATQGLQNSPVETDE